MQNKPPQPCGCKKLKGIQTVLNETFSVSMLHFVVWTISNLSRGKLCELLKGGKCFLCNPSPPERLNPIEGMSVNAVEMMIFATALEIAKALGVVEISAFDTVHLTENFSNWWNYFFILPSPPSPEGIKTLADVGAVPVHILAQGLIWTGVSTAILNLCRNNNDLVQEKKKDDKSISSVVQTLLLENWLLNATPENKRDKKWETNEKNFLSELGNLDEGILTRALSKTQQLQKKIEKIPNDKRDQNWKKLMQETKERIATLEEIITKREMKPLRK